MSVSTRPKVPWELRQEIIFYTALCQHAFHLSTTALTNLCSAQYANTLSATPSHPRLAALGLALAATPYSSYDPSEFAMRGDWAYSGKVTRELG